MGIITKTMSWSYQILIIKYDWSIELYPNANSSYSLFPIKVNIDGLEPEDNYFSSFKSSFCF